MRLLTDKTMNNSKITITMETVDFNAEETKAIQMVGDPFISFEKNYPGGHSVCIAKKRLKHGFRIKVDFDGKDNIELAVSTANEFCEDIKELLENKLSDVMEVYSNISYDFKPEKEFIPIKPVY